MRKKLIMVALLAGLAGSVLATTWDNTVGGTVGYPAFLGRPVYTMAKTVNFATDTNNYASGDVIKLFNVPATTVVLSVTYKVSTACTNAAFFDIGTAVNSNTFCNALDGNTALAETLYATPLLVKAVDDIRMVVKTNAAGNTGVITVKANMLNVNFNP